MRAITISRHGERDVLTYTTDFPKPSPAPGEVLVGVASTGLNQVDLVVRRGYPGLAISLPHIPGGDIAGTIEAVGEGVDRSMIGRRIVAYPMIACGKCQLCLEGKPNLCLNWKFFGMHMNGGYSEYVCIPAANAFSLPNNITWAEAVALPVAGLTAYHGLKNVGKLKAGETFFIWGGSGGLGTIAIQIAKQLGATVIATGNSESKLNVMSDLGADYVFNRLTEDIPAEVAKISPAGIDVILDYVGPETFPKSFQMVKKGGRILLCGIITGREVSPFSLHMTYLRHLSVQGLYLGTMEEFAEVIDWTTKGLIKPYIGWNLPLEEAVEATRRLEEREFIGKIALTI